jgi:hypothetical protein
LRSVGCWGIGHRGPPHQLVLGRGEFLARLPDT